MTPEEFADIKKEQVQIIAMAQETIEAARLEASLSKIPENVRPATADDLVEGNVIWHIQPDGYGDPYWHIIEMVDHRTSRFKGYCADDGCRYGLDRAFVSC